MTTDVCIHTNAHGFLHANAGDWVVTRRKCYFQGPKENKKEQMTAWILKS